MARSDRHSEWLSLIEVSGPFLSVEVLDRVFPQGLDEHDPEVLSRVRLAFDEWADDQMGLRADPRLHDQWLAFVLSELLEFPHEVIERSTERFAVDVAEQHVAVTPDVAIVDPDDRGPRLLISLWPAGQSLDEPPSDDAWAASPLERMTLLCNELGAFGLVTNGRRWTFVHAATGETPGFASWYAHLWVEEPLTLRAFRTLMGARRFFASAENETLSRMLADSALAQEAVTSQLGLQVRRAVEVLVQALDRADLDSGRQLLADVPDDQLYEAAVTVMMRLVFLFSAEECDLLLLGEPLYDQFYAASPLSAQLRAEADRVGVQVLERRLDAWARLCATFRAVHGGVEHDRLRLIAYGGSLFDPDRFPFLEGRQPGTSWRDAEAVPLQIDNRTVLHLLEALQLLQERGREPRRLSFRALDVEQIGHVYEGLLDHQAVRVDEPYLGLEGAAGLEPEVPLSRLKAATGDADALVAALREATKRSESALRKRLDVDLDAGERERLMVACGNDHELFDQVRPYAGLLREDAWGYPLVYPANTLLVTTGLDRRSTQTYYTPRALAEEIVQYTLEPLAYVGPAEGKPREEWQLRPVGELLDLKICDPTMGSGAFLVASCRWLGERVVEAWAAAAERYGSITLEGEPSSGAATEHLVPREAAEQLALARRLVAERCLYGVDINPFAVEMAKLSVWLVTLAKDRPFGFLDHALKCGDSLLGVTSLDQVRYMHLDPERGKVVNKNLWFDFEQEIAPVVERALETRAELESFPVLEPVDAARKAGLHAEAEAQLDRVRLFADATIACAMAEAAGLGSYDNLLARVREDIAGGRPGVRVELARMLNLGAAGAKRARRTFHWPIEFPEAFGPARGGFDASLANPPYVGNKYWKERVGSVIQPYFERAFGRKLGKPDLVVLFLWRMQSILRAGGTLGGLATQSITEVTARNLLDDVFYAQISLYRAARTRPWPGSATVQVSLVWAARGAWEGQVILDGGLVPRIGTDLKKQRSAAEPFQLQSRLLAFEGVHNARGLAFVVPAEHQLAKSEPSFFKPYLSGEDLVGANPLAPPRYVLDLTGHSKESLADLPPSVRGFLTNVVRPTRMDTALRSYKGLNERWWTFWNTRETQYAVSRRHQSCIVMPSVSKYAVALELPSPWVYTNKVVVFVKEREDLQAVLLSTAFDVWIDAFGGTLGGTRVLKIANVANTFPLPAHGAGRETGSQWQVDALAALAGAGPGLTETLNAVHDPECMTEPIVRLRSTIDRLDSAVAESYGWTAQSMVHDFRETPNGVRWGLAEAVRDGILNRLLELNHQRHEEDVTRSGSTARRHSRGDVDAVPTLPMFPSPNEANP